MGSVSVIVPKVGLSVRIAALPKAEHVKAVRATAFILLHLSALSNSAFRSRCGDTRRRRSGQGQRTAGREMTARCALRRLLVRDRQVFGYPMFRDNERERAPSFTGTIQRRGNGSGRGRQRRLASACMRYTPVPA